MFYSNKKKYINVLNIIRSQSDFRINLRKYELIVIAIEIILIY